MNDAKLLVELDAHPAVQSILGASGLGTPDDPARLDEATIRLAGPVGRRITQAVSRALYEREPRPAGLAYRSRLDDAERCWALYGETLVRFGPAAWLSVEDPSHIDAVRAVANLYELPLPAVWKLGWSCRQGSAARAPPEERPGGVRQGRLLEAPPSDLQIHLGCRQVSVPQEALHLGQRGPGVRAAWHRCGAARGPGTPVGE